MKTGAAGARCDFDGSAVLLDEALRDGESEPVALFAAGDQRIKDLVAYVVGYAGSIVDHLQFECQLVMLLRQRDLARSAAAKNDLALAQHRLRRVARNVEDGLDQLLAVAGDVGQRGVIVAAHADLVVFGVDQAAHAFEDLVDVHQRRLHRPMRRKQALHQVLQAVGLVDDDLGVFLSGSLTARRSSNCAEPRCRRADS